MSTRYYTLIDYGLVLTFSEMCELLKTYKGDNEELKKRIENNNVNDVDFIDDLLYNDFYEFDVQYNFEGDFNNFIGRNKKTFEETPMYYLPLAKSNIFDEKILFTKHDNEEDVINEIRLKLKKMKLDVDIGFIKWNVGNVTGVYLS